jgi:3-deoxy-7-phosphoheptulonate synthase
MAYTPRALGPALMEPDVVALPSPSALQRQWPLSAPRLQALVRQARASIRLILHQADPRKLVVLCPGPLTDWQLALSLARRMRVVRERCGGTMEIIFRVDLETLVQAELACGLHRVRPLLLELLATGVPLGCAFRDTLMSRYVDDLLSWAQVSACSTESQLHREMASGTSMPMGFETSADGDIRVAVDAIHAASTPHHFISIDDQGHVAVVATRGNPDGHLLARCGFSTGGATDRIAALRERLGAHPRPVAVVVDARPMPDAAPRSPEQAWEETLEALCLWNDAVAKAADAALDVKNRQGATTFLY